MDIEKAKERDKFVTKIIEDLAKAVDDNTTALEALGIAKEPATDLALFSELLARVSFSIAVIPADLMDMIGIVAENNLKNTPFPNELAKANAFKVLNTIRMLKIFIDNGNLSMMPENSTLH